MVKGNKRREGGTMPSQGFSKLCYKRAFDSGEGMGRGWEWVGLVRRGGGGGSEDVRPYCARCVSSLCIEIIDSLMSWGLFVLIMLTVLTVRWWASPRSMSIKRSGLKSSM